MIDHILKHIEKFNGDKKVELFPVKFIFKEFGEEANNCIEGSNEYDYSENGQFRELVSDQLLRSNKLVPTYKQVYASKQTYDLSTNRMIIEESGLQHYKAYFNEDIRLTHYIEFTVDNKVYNYQVSSLFYSSKPNKFFISISADDEEKNEYIITPIHFTIELNHRNFRLYTHDFIKTVTGRFTEVVKEVLLDLNKIERVTDETVGGLFKDNNTLIHLRERLNHFIMSYLYPRQDEYCVKMTIDK